MFGHFMDQIKYAVLGAGPSGLSVANALLAMGEESVVVLEKESEPGGLCRSAEVDGGAIDIGGGHFLDESKPEVLDFLFRFLPRSEWNRFDRVAKIRIRGQEIDHPLEGNLWQLPVEDQIDFLESIVATGSVIGTPMPERFSEWVEWKLGKKIAGEYMNPYNRKIWSMDLDELGTYWLYKLPNVSFRDVLESCLRQKSCGALPAHGTFLYPKQGGYGEVWRRMGAALGDRLRCNTPLRQIDTAARVLNGSIQYQVLINTIPWPCWTEATTLPAEVTAAVELLQSCSIRVEYHPESAGSKAHWIYEPDERLPHHRLLLRENFLPGARGYWTEANRKRVSGESANWHHDNLYAYPVNTLRKPEAVRVITQWAVRNHVRPVGRWGKWEHMNSDIAVAEGLAVARELQTIHE